MRADGDLERKAKTWDQIIVSVSEISKRLNSFVMSFKSHTLDSNSCLRDETGVSRLGE